jgi:hypothetical protein
MLKSSGQLLSLFCAIWPIIFTPISFGLYYAYDSDNFYRESGVHQIPTISLAGSRLPSSAVLTYGLHLEAFALFLLFISIYQETNRRIELTERNNQPFDAIVSKSNTSWVERVVEYSTCLGCTCCCTQSRLLPRSLLRLNRVSCALGLIAALCMSIVASIQLTANESAHGSFSFLMFMSGILHVLVYYYGVSKTSTLKLHPTGQLLRQLCIFLSIPFNICLIVIAGIVRLSCSSYSCRAFAVDIAPALEFSTVVALLFYLASFYSELQHVKLIIAIEPATSDEQIGQ